MWYLSLKVIPTASTKIYHLQHTHSAAFPKELHQMFIGLNRTNKSNLSVAVHAKRAIEPGSQLPPSPLVKQGLM